MVRKTSSWMALVFAVAGSGCLGGATTTTTGDPTGSNNTPAPAGPVVGDTGTGSTAPTNESAGTSGGMDTTFDHEREQIDPFAALARIQEMGPPEISTRLHSCQKMKYATLGNLLVQLGVNLQRTATPDTAGELYTRGAQALGAPSYDSRIGEAVELTTAGATKLFDIFVQAAPEIVTAMPTLDHCMKAGVGTQMFDANGLCTLDGISCLTGVPGTQAQKDLCDNVLTSASTPQIGQAIAVATLLSAAHTCE